MPKVGDFPRTRAPNLSLVYTSSGLVEANFKETDLTHVAVGQPVDIRLDTYPDRRWRGSVASISQATGAEFSVIPAQNATGNWVKIAQRIPVRIAIETRDDDPSLRAGMSVVAEVDTGLRRTANWFGAHASE